MVDQTPRLQPLSTVSTVPRPRQGQAGDKEQILAWIRTNPDLPTPPAVALQIIDRASHPDCELGDLSQIIAQDPALCGKVLRTVNSVMYGLRYPATSIPAAIRCLGIRPLRSLVLTLTLSSVRSAPLPPEILQTYWRVSVAGALAAHQLALRARRPAADNDLAAGLMRDLGMLVLHQLFPVEYKSILTTSPAILSGFQCELEEEAVQLNHAEVSAELLRNWRLPEEITEPIRHHHHWDRIERLPVEMRERTRLLYFGSLIGQLQLTSDRPMLVREVLTVANKYYTMNEKELREFLASLQKNMEEFASIIQVDLGGVVEYASVMNRGIEELMRLAMQSSLKLSQPGRLSRSDTPRTPQAERKPASRLLSAPGARQTRIVHRRLGATVDYRNPEAPAELDLSELLTLLRGGTAPTGTLGVVNGYQIQELIGCGGMGAVFRALDSQLERTVAIKTLLPELAREPRARARFLQEGRAVATLTHENIAQIYAVGEAGGLPYLVMEFVQGMSLAERLLREAPLTLADIIRIGLQTASGLSVAHARGLVHCDVKPANLLLETATRRIKIVDFGLAQASNAIESRENGGLVGTPHFMSPEQADGRPTDPRSDMFSFGSVLYTACTGQLPFDADSVPALLKEILEAHPAPVRAHNPKLPSWLEEIVGGLLAKDPARRFPTAEELKRVFLCRWANLFTSRGPASSL